MGDQPKTLSTSLFRNALLQALLGGEKYDIDTECGYPKDISPQQYREMYDREGISARVVDCLPEESWALDPEVYETEDPQETEFEKAWKALVEEKNLFHFLLRIDQLSGVATYGVLLIGVGDGKDLKEPLEGVGVDGTKAGSGKQQQELLFLRAFDESVISIAQRETDIHNPRYGQPTMYNINFSDTGLTGSGEMTTKSVHWTRVIHVADNRGMSEVFGAPRMKKVYNRLLDIRKILSGSAEMFWKGAFPGVNFVLDPKLVEQGVELDATTIREEFQSYMNGLQRYMALTGVTANQMAPQVVDPTGHLESHMKNIAISLSIPFRILFGSEQAQLASSQDAKAWDKRIKRRQTKYLTPMLLRPFVDRLIAIGVLPEPTEYHINWPDLTSPSDDEKADVAVKRTQALAQYVGGGVDSLVPPRAYFVNVLGMSTDEAEAMIKEAEEYQEDLADEDEMDDATPPEDEQLVPPADDEIP